MAAGEVMKGIRRGSLGVGAFAVIPTSQKSIKLGFPQVRPLFPSNCSISAGAEGLAGQEYCGGVAAWFKSGKRRQPKPRVMS